MKALLTGSGRGIACLFLLGIGILLAAPAADAASYRLTDIGNLSQVQGGYIELAVTGINQGGDVVGWSNVTSASQRHAFLWHDGMMKDLGTLGSHTDSEARRINNAGQIIGTSSSTWLGTPPRRAVLWENEAITDLGTLSPGNEGESHGNGINQAGQMVGGAKNVWGNGHAFLFEMGKPKIDLTPDALESYALAINDLGHIVGAIQNTIGPNGWVNVLWKNGGPQELGLPPGGFTGAGVVDINNAGQVLLNVVDSNGMGRPFLWQNGVWTDLGLLPGSDSCLAGGLNNLGQVVGSAIIPVTAGNYHYFVFTAFLWQNGVMQDLKNLIPPDPEMSLGGAGAINDRGQIAAVYATKANWDESRGLLLTPVPQAVAGPAMLLLQ